MDIRPVQVSLIVNADKAVFQLQAPNIRGGDIVAKDRRLGQHRSGSNCIHRHAVPCAAENHALLTRSSRSKPPSAESRHLVGNCRRKQRSYIRALRGEKGRAGVPASHVAKHDDRGRRPAPRRRCRPGRARNLWETLRNLFR